MINIQVFWDVMSIDQPTSLTSQKTLIFILQIFFLYIELCSSRRYPHVTVVGRQTSVAEVVMFSCFCVRRLSVSHGVYNLNYKCM